ncbi:hypothetical protein V1525DRAFT_401437 [Lipomyces kononenkoae]|uniref:Uncharacterized protein n=1 Tax=Lipomyces kononenkoae TaxID=34357 RepID=A0ACC3T3V2_LIPKO
MSSVNATPTLATSWSFSSLDSGYNGEFDNLISSGGNTSRSSLASVGPQAQFFDLLSCPPILVGLIENIGVNDLRSLRLVHSHANNIIAGSPVYHKYLQQLAISCSDATFACRWSRQKSRCFRCGAHVCINCISGLAAPATYMQRSRRVCNFCRSALIRGHCLCEITPRWVCRKCHLIEIRQDREDQSVYVSSCHLCRRPIDKFSTFLSSLVTREHCLCSWCNKWMA